MDRAGVTKPCYRKMTPRFTGEMTFFLANGLANDVNVIERARCAAALSENGSFAAGEAEKNSECGRNLRYRRCCDEEAWRLFPRLLYAVNFSPLKANRWRKEKSVIKFGTVFFTERLTINNKRMSTEKALCIIRSGVLPKFNIRHDTACRKKEPLQHMSVVCIAAGSRGSLRYIDV